MALKSTIHKVSLDVADLDRNYYHRHVLTVAKHPSETDERMMLRLVAFARHADSRLAFGAGLCDSTEPDLWCRDLTGNVDCWIDLGQPDERRIAKACGRAAQVVIYAYGGQATRQWWQQLEGRLGRFRNLSVFAVAPDAVRSLGSLAERSMDLYATVNDDTVLLVSRDASIEIAVEYLLRRP